MSAALPPGPELVEVDGAALVLVERLEGGAHLLLAEAHAQSVQQPAQLALVNLAVAVLVEAIETVTQRVRAHLARLRRFLVLTNSLLLLAASTADLPPLQASWLERLGSGDEEVVVTPPLGATVARPLVVGVHGAGDRPEWSCGGWRLGSLANSFVACPHGSKSSADRYAWASAAQLAARVEVAVTQTRARFGAYVDQGPLIYAGFSQGATLAEPLLLEHAARFPIAILAEGGYALTRSPSFARAFREKGGRRLVLVCGTRACFQNARAARKGLEHAGLQVLVVGDEQAGHNLNERMQKALQSAWPEISAPLQLPETGHAEH